MSSSIVKQSRAIYRSQVDDDSTLKTALCNGTSRPKAALLATCRTVIVVCLLDEAGGPPGADDLRARAGSRLGIIAHLDATDR